MPERLTETFVRSLTFDGKPQVIRDTRVVGLMVAVNKRSKTYKIQRDLWQGPRGRRQLVKTVRRTLGSTEEMSLEDARTEATRLLQQIKLGVDPNAAPVAASPSARDWTVERMYHEYAADMRARECAERTIDDLLKRFERYLADWARLALTEVRRSMARDAHGRITRDHGPRAANQALKDFRAAYNLALKIVDDPDDLPGNPVMAVTFNKERASNRVIMPEDLPDWRRRVEALQNPLRRNMHLLGLLSGLRPGTLVSLERDWVRLADRAIAIPRMKSGRAFALPLSEPMAELIEQTLAVSETLYPEAAWVFPTRSSKTKAVIATQVWKEKTLPSETGHILRHTYRTIAQRVGIDHLNARLLLDHAVPGIDGVYVHERALFDSLLAEQTRMTAEICKLAARPLI